MLRKGELRRAAWEPPLLVDMIDYMLLAIALAVVAVLVLRAARIWTDSRALGWRLPRRLGWALLGALAWSSYWSDARVRALEGEAEDERPPDSLTCPLCGTEVPHAWTLDKEGRAAVARGPIHCPACDLRLDACRHCAHFLPGSPRGWAQAGFGSDDITFGCCGFYKSVQPVEQAVDADMARRLRDRGYDQIRAPLPIVDSFVPPDSCRVYKPDRGRLKRGGVQWPDARQVALMKGQRPGF